MLRVFHKGRCFIKQLQEQFQVPGVEALWPVEGLGGQGDGCAGEVPLVVEFAGVLEYLVPNLPDVVQRQVCGQVHLYIRVMPVHVGTACFDQSNQPHLCAGNGQGDHLLHGWPGSGVYWVRLLGRGIHVGNSSRFGIGAWRATLNLLDIFDCLMSNRFFVMNLSDVQNLADD
ncbi:hypothetical protein [Delftia acidovorans]|uniref:hypothetical protein n=1 Tax=Delftia acidovorans TaxID=80866 RepID=UPI00286EE93B|nr:hypothetical protein [Delftia acidovorans]